MKQVIFVIFGSSNDDAIKAHDEKEAMGLFLQKYPNDEVLDVEQLPFE